MQQRAYLLALLVATMLLESCANDNEGTAANPTSAVTTPVASVSSLITATDFLPVPTATSLSVTPVPTLESYCMWPDETLSDISERANIKLADLQQFNPHFTSFAGATLWLPLGSIPPAKWQHPRPVVNGMSELPFGVSGYYIGANNRRKQVALTFDIGYVPENTEVMKMLAERGIEATYFVIGIAMSRHPDVVTDILKYGHELANHSWTHENMQGMREAEIMSELQQTEAAVQEAHPEATSKPFFRAPFGAISEEMVAIARREGYYVIGWTVDSRDWTDGITADGVYERVISHTCPGAIIVMHDVSDANREAIPRIVDYLERQGYEMVKLSRLLFS